MEQCSLCTDEVQALVLDPGYSATRAGFAGEDHPKSVTPTHYGSYIKGDSTSPTYIFGDNGMHDYTVPNVDVSNPLAGGGVEDWVQDWDVAARLWEYAITSRLTGPRKTPLQKNGTSSDKEGDDDVKMGDEDADGLEDDEGDDNPLCLYPLLMSEPGKSSAKSREKIIEIAMENWEVPAFYLQKTGVLAA
jgi:actin-related protein 4